MSTLSPSVFTRHDCGERCQSSHRNGLRHRSRHCRVWRQTRKVWTTGSYPTVGQMRALRAQSLATLPRGGETLPWHRARLVLPCGTCHPADCAPRRQLASAADPVWCPSGGSAHEPLLVGGECRAQVCRCSWARGSSWRLNRLSVNKVAVMQLWRHGCRMTLMRV